MAHLGPHLYTEESNDIVEPATDVFEIDDFTSPSDWEKVVMSSNLQQTEHKIRYLLHLAVPRNKKYSNHLSYLLIIHFVVCSETRTCYSRMGDQ